MLWNSVSFHDEHKELIITGPKLACAVEHCRLKRWMRVGGCACSAAHVPGTVFIQKCLPYKGMLSGQYKTEKKVAVEPFTKTTRRIGTCLKYHSEKQPTLIASMSVATRRDVANFIEALQPTRPLVRRVLLNRNDRRARIEWPGAITVDFYMRVVHVSECCCDKMCIYTIKYLVNVDTPFSFYTVNKKFGAKLICSQS